MFASGEQGDLVMETPEMYRGRLIDHIQLVVRRP